jgi:SnoaL-like domain
MGSETDLMRDEWALRKLAMEYARTCDRGDGAGFAALFTPDGAIDGPGFHVDGYDQLFANPGVLKQMYQSTMHSRPIASPITSTGRKTASRHGWTGRSGIRTNMSGRTGRGSTRIGSFWSNGPSCRP